MQSRISKIRRLIIYAGIPFLIGSTHLRTLAATESTPINSSRIPVRSVPGQREAGNERQQYILGPGDILLIELLDLPELSGRFPIGPDGTLYLPRLRHLYVEGLTVQELKKLLKLKFKLYVREPEIYIRTVSYRPVRVYVGGEVQRPGYYTLSGSNQNPLASPVENLSEVNSLTNFSQLSSSTVSQDVTTRERGNIAYGASSTTLFPTVYDAIRVAQGITPYTDLSNVQVTRKRPIRSGEGRIKTNLNFLSLITEGDESQNIRLYDGDVLEIAKSNKVLREQILKARKSNLNPRVLQVFVSGRVDGQAGIVNVPQGAGLNQALAQAGGPKLLRGKVEFVRYDTNGDVERSVFYYDPKAPLNTRKNPLLMSGDLIRVQDSFLSAASEILREVSTPAIGVYSLYNLFGGDD